MVLPRKKHPSFTLIWVVRILIGLVLLDNFQAALLFMILPKKIAPGFELSGSAGNAMIQGVGLLFLIWCVPYAVAMWNPVKHKVALIESIVMQAIALVGETILYLLLPEKSPVLTSSVLRFILFDGIGLLFQLVAGGMLWIPKFDKK